MEADYTAVAQVADIPQGSCKALEVGGRNIIVAHLEDGFHVVENRCSHAASQLDATRILKGGQLLCPLHGARFDICSGAAKTAPAFRPIATYKCRVANGMVEAAVPPRIMVRPAPRPFGAQTG